jgi:hypothetical protein
MSYFSIPAQTNPAIFSPLAVVGGWVELGRHTLGSPGDTLEVGSLPNKEYYMILWNGIATGNLDDCHLRMGNTTIDTGSNYSSRYQTSGGADTAATSQSSIIIDKNNGAFNTFGQFFISNLSGQEKIFQGHRVKSNTAGAANAPLRLEATGKWVNTSNPLDILRITNIGSGSFDTGSEMIVLGWDPADTHTTNFWEELASEDLSGGVSDTLNSSTFTAKKYLWVQAYLESTGGAVTQTFRMGASGSIDTGTNYARRYSINGGADVTEVSKTSAGEDNNTSGALFANYFIVNNSATEKLVTGHAIQYNTAGAAAAPNRTEISSKWTNTSAQANIFGFANAGAGDYGTKSILKVWGSD